MKTKVFFTGEVGSITNFFDKGSRGKFHSLPFLGKKGVVGKV